ncbi:MAG: right-handed parallel beta-helix repeat-containing protein [Chloroflexota bacterium]
MKRRIHFSVLLLALIAALLASAVRPYAVYADEGAEPEATAEPTEPIEETSDKGDEQPGVEEEPRVAEEQVTVAEILEQIPEDTELVVVDETGEVEPLVTEAAAEIVSTSDPMWCPAGATPGDAGCTGSFGDFASLLAALQADATSGNPPVYSGSGVVWVADAYNGEDNNQITFDGSVLTNLNGNNLTVQGGWSGGNNTTITGTSLVDVSMVFVNWTGNVTLNDLDIAGAADDAGFGLLVSNTGNVTLDNVSVTNTALNSYGSGEGAIVETSGSVDVTDSNFDNNAGNGLQVQAGGNIGLNTVSASDNTLTGAYLNSCLYDAASELCAGNGSVTITGATTNVFNGNGFSGLVVDSGGGIAINNTQASNNGLDGAYLTSADADGTGDVSVDESEFSGNTNGIGLDVLTDGNIDLTSVDASNNGTGIVLQTTTTGAIDVTDVNVTDNTWTGLHADSGGNIDLLDVVAYNNGANGAYLDAEGDITIENSTFNQNVHFNFPQDPGLYAHSNGGNITLINVIADGNLYGAGAVLTTSGNGVISVTGVNSHFNGNGTYGLQAENSNGGITLSGIDASYNGVKGVYLSSSGTGNISIVNSVFVENGSYGIYAVNNQGDITLDGVTVTGDDGVGVGDDLTDIGAVLKALNGGNVFVTSSTFELNTATGLRIIGSNQVNLFDVAADGNGGNGVEVYSTYTASCTCPDSEVVNVVVNVNGGMFTNNAGYGLMVKPGPEGDLLYIAPSIFGGNGAGDDLLDLSDPPECEKCGCDPEPGDTKGPNVVEVPFTGGEPVEQNCDLFSSTILQLPNGSWINVGCPFEGFSNLEGILEDGLPGPLGAGTEFLAGLKVGLTDADGNVVLNEDGTITITFKIPEDSRARSYSVLFWDPTLNDGNGGWVRMPIFEAGTSFPLHPENPDDGRVVLSGVQRAGDTVTLTVNFSGTFVLITP